MMIKSWDGSHFLNRATTREHVERWRGSETRGQISFVGRSLALGGVE